jgi:hypothetical protein
MGDHGYIGEELFGNSPNYELEQKCFVVKKVVQDNIFSLDEALFIYQVDREDYENYLKNLY